MDENLKKNLTAGDKWLRLIFMILFAIVNYIVQYVIWLIAIVQFIFSAVTGKPNQNLLTFSQSLTAYSYQMIRYLAYCIDDKPFPFGSWPSESK